MRFFFEDARVSCDHVPMTMYRFASPHTSSLAASMLEDIDVISERTLPRVIAAMLFEQGVTADEFYSIGRGYRGVSYNKPMIIEALRGLESGELQLADCLRGADQIQSVIDKTRLLVSRRARMGRYVPG